MATAALPRTAPEPPPPLRLYEIANEYRAALDLAYDDQGELSPMLEALLAEIDDRFDAKVERCILLANELRASAAVAKDEADRLKTRARVDENAAERLHSYVMSMMALADRKTVQTARVRVTLTPNPPRFDWTDDPAKLPEEFRRVVPETIAVDKEAVREWFKAHDETLPDPRFSVTRGQRLTIK